MWTDEQFGYDIRIHSARLYTSSPDYPFLLRSAIVLSYRFLFVIPPPRTSTPVTIPPTQSSSPLVSSPCHLTLLLSDFFNISLDFCCTLISFISYPVELCDSHNHRDFRIFATSYFSFLCCLWRAILHPVQQCWSHHCVVFGGPFYTPYSSAGLTTVLIVDIFCNQIFTSLCSLHLIHVFIYMQIVDIA